MSAFDSIFEGPPSDVVAASNSVGLGVDVANNNLYVNAGKGGGWEEITVSADNLPIATDSSLGVVQPDGSTITITDDGVITANIPLGPVYKQSAFALAQTADNSNVLTFATSLSGLYQINFYVVSANAPTGATLPAVEATFVDFNTGNSTVASSATVGSVSAENVTNTGVLTINNKSGNSIVVSTTGYAAGSGTALSYNVYAYITYLEE